MYIQPYEPQEFGFPSSTLNENGSPETPAARLPAGDTIAPANWMEPMAGIEDASGALEDAPFGQIGVGSMLQNLTGMMQQILQMMQSLIGRAGEADAGGCTQGTLPQDRRYSIEPRSPSAQ